MSLFHYFSVYPEAVLSILWDLFLILTSGVEEISHKSPTENDQLVWFRGFSGNSGNSVLVASLFIKSMRALQRSGRVLFWGFVSDGILPGIVVERVASNLGPVGWRPGLGGNSRVYIISTELCLGS